MVNEIEIEVLESLRKGIEEFSKELTKKATMYNEFREDMVRTAIALMQGKYRIANPEELKGLEKDNIDTILLTYNCFGSLKAIIKTKKGTDRIISIKIIEDEEVSKMLELMKIQQTTLKKILEKTKEEKEKELKKKEKEMKELKELMIERLIEKDDIEGLKDFIFFHGDLETTKMALEYAIEMKKDVKKVAEALSYIEGADTIAYLLYQIDKEKAFEFMDEFGIDFEVLKQDFGLEA